MVGRTTRGRCGVVSKILRLEPQSTMTTMDVDEVGSRCSYKERPTPKFFLCGRERWSMQTEDDDQRDVGGSRLTLTTMMMVVMGKKRKGRENRPVSVRFSSLLQKVLHSRVERKSREGRCVTLYKFPAQLPSPEGRRQEQLWRGSFADGLTGCRRLLLFVITSETHHPAQARQPEGSRQALTRAYLA